MPSAPIDIREAKTRLSRLMDQAAAGQDVILARRGKPVARLSQLAPPIRKVRFGVLKGRVRVAADFDAPLPDTVDAALNLNEPFRGHRPATRALICQAEVGPLPCKGNDPRRRCCPGLAGEPARCGR